MNTEPLDNQLQCLQTNIREYPPHVLLPKSSLLDESIVSLHRPITMMVIQYITSTLSVLTKTILEIQYQTNAILAKYLSVFSSSPNAKSKVCSDVLDMIRKMHIDKHLICDVHDIEKRIVCHV